MDITELDRKGNASEVLGLFPAEVLHLDPVQRKVSVAIYRLLAEGQPVPIERIGRATDLSVGLVSEILDQWFGVYYDDDHRIIGYWGLAIPKMSHRFEVGGRTLYTWCAWDALFIPEILQKTAHVVSTCPVTGEEIRLDISPERAESVGSQEIFVSFILPDKNDVQADVIGSFCHYVFFFSSAQAGQRWVSEHADTFLLPLKEAFSLGKEKNRQQYHQLLESQK